MTEQQIRDGYEQLDSALAPPRDAHERVARRVVQRRRRRRVATTGAVALGMVVVTGAVVTQVSGDDGTDQVAVDPPTEASALVLTRPDGSTVEFSDFTVTCKEPSVGGSLGPGEGIWLHSPFHFEEGGPSGDERLQQPFVYFEGRLDTLQGDRTFTLPVDNDGGSTEYQMTLFVADTEGGPDGNEVVSDGNSSGTVRMLRAECEPTPVLELVVDATLGSEEQLQSLDVAGTVR